MRAILFLVVMMAACSRPPPIVPPPPPVEPDPHPRLNTKFSWHLARGFSLFAGTRATAPAIRGLYGRFRMEWPNLRLTARVCAELQSWPYITPGQTPDEPRWLPRGVTARPFNRKAPAYKQLKEFLDVAVTIPDAQVLVVAICNLKEDGTKPEKRLQWVRNICELVGSYPNTAIEIANEYIHPNSSIDVPEMKKLIRACITRAPKTQVGTDTNINRIRRAYDPDLAPLVDFFSYHPWRNPDPTKEELRRIVGDRIGASVFSETTAFADPKWGNLGGCCTRDKGQVIDHARNVEKAGGVHFYHMVWGLCWPNCSVGYIIPRGDWPIRHGK